MDITYTAQERLNMFNKVQDAYTSLCATDIQNEAIDATELRERVTTLVRSFGEPVIDSIGSYINKPEVFFEDIYTPTDDEPYILGTLDILGRYAYEIATSTDIFEVASYLKNFGNLLIVTVLYFDDAVRDETSAA